MSSTTSTCSAIRARAARAARLLALALGVLLWAPVAHADGVLLAVTESNQGVDGFWWANTEAPQWTATDVALRGILQELGVSVVDPAAMASPPVVSRVVYGHAPLSSTNAINLASLFGANRVITGEARYESVPAAPLVGHPGFRVLFRLHVFSTTSAVELLPMDVEEVAYAEAPERARAEAAARALARVRSLLASASAWREAEVGIAYKEPVLVITGMDHAAPLVEIKRWMKSDGDIADVLELWAAEGVIAVEINPGQTDPPEAVVRAVDRLLQHEFEGFAIQEVAREPDRIEVMVLSRQRAEVPPTPM